MSMTFRSLFGFLFAFICTAVLLPLLRSKLPQDHGRALAVNGDKSKGKARGGGVLFIPVFVLSSLLFVPFSIELAAYLFFTLAAMLTGYLDDRSSLPWGELKKGLLDLVICILAVCVFMYSDKNTSIRLFQLSIVLPRWLYFLFALFVLWAFINCCNCSDGVDGLLGTLSVISLTACALLFTILSEKEVWSVPCLLLIGTVLAYLLYNASPSILMMGDAGSRAIGLFMGLMILKTGNMFLSIPFCIVILLDGGLGLVKLSVRRIFHSRTFMERPLTPLHDEARKNQHWSDTATVTRFAIIQFVLCAVEILYLGTH